MVHMLSTCATCVCVCVCVRAYRGILVPELLVVLLYTVLLISLIIII